jgi:hypothetical protein
VAADAMREGRSSDLFIMAHAAAPHAAIRNRDVLVNVLNDSAPDSRAGKVRAV